MAFSDARFVAADGELTVDVVIIGAGAAGITLADSLSGRGMKVIVVESGGFTESNAHQLLYRGASIGIPYPPLERSRLRYFGGTTNHWAGWCRPPRAEDFAARAWVPNSGWPITLDDLDNYLARAAGRCDLAGDSFQLDDWLTPQDHLPPFDQQVFDTRLIRFSLPTRFAQKYKQRLAGHEAVTVMLNANMIGLEMSDGGDHVGRVHLKTLEQKPFSVRAAKVVLATGGIENARLLLSSSARSRLGVGNEHDQVGRYFMDHFKYALGILTIEPDVPLDFYQSHHRKGSRLKGVLGLTPDVLRRFEILPAHTEFIPLPDQAEQRRYRVDVRIDPAPNVDSRIRLDAPVDRFGMPRVLVNLQHTEVAQRTFRLVNELLHDALNGMDIGRFDSATGFSGKASLESATVTATGFHHMGATRMSDDPANGVVDRDCRVHTVDNLYIAGCSVFPGYEGYPTLTLVALALRLADHLADQFDAGLS
ncbi:MAG: dehydrogenase [marine bacterium B5-7]|nr:MAG: dehydrogenase [marine bacterium B5-7]